MRFETNMKVNQLLEARLVKPKGWFWAIEQDVKMTLRQGYDKEQTLSYLEWARDNKKTLNHLYRALQIDAQQVADDVEEHMGQRLTGEELVYRWIGDLDYRELTVYQELKKLLPHEELDYVARMMVDVVADEIRNAN